MDNVQALTFKKAILHLAPYNEYLSIGFIDVLDYANHFIEWPEVTFDPFLNGQRTGFDT